MLTRRDELVDIDDRRDPPDALGTWSDDETTAIYRAGLLRPGGSQQAQPAPSTQARLFVPPIRPIRPVSELSHRSRPLAAGTIARLAPPMAAGVAAHGEPPVSQRAGPAGAAMSTSAGAAVAAEPTQARPTLGVCLAASGSMAGLFLAVLLGQLLLHPAAPSGAAMQDTRANTPPQPGRPVSPAPLAAELANHVQPTHTPQAASGAATRAAVSGGRAAAPTALGAVELDSRAARSASRVGRADPSAPRPGFVSERSHAVTPRAVEASSVVATHSASSHTSVRSRQTQAVWQDPEGLDVHASSRPVPSSDAVLRVNSRPWAQIFIDGKFAGNTPQLELRLSAGTHHIRLYNPVLDMSKAVRLRVRAGETITRVETLQ